MDSADAVNIENNQYTELEWCLKAIDAAQYGEQYWFRVTANGGALNTYPANPPQWTISHPTAVILRDFTAAEYEGKVLLRWRTSYEVNNLGFHVYREEDGQIYRLTPELVAGSALLAGSRTPLTAGRHYSWWDFPDGALTLEEHPPGADSRSGPSGFKDRGKNLPSASGAAVLERSAL